MILNANNFGIIANGTVTYGKRVPAPKNLREIPGANWYFQISDIHGFTDEFIDTVIPAQFQTLIIQNKIGLIIHHCNEGYHSIIEFVYRRLIIEKKFPSKQIIFITGSLNIVTAVHYYATKFNENPIKVYCLSLSENGVALNIQVDKSLDKLPITKKFLNLNRRWRPHRPAFIGLLAAKNLLEKGYVSFASKVGDDSWDNMFDYAVELSKTNDEVYNLLKENETKIRNLPSLILDTAELETPDKLISLNYSMLDYYRSTLFSVVSETYFYTKPNFENSIFFSEKIFKPIAFKHPFILLSTPGSLQALRDRGYKTFDNIIDESYDKELDDATRMLMILKEVERLSNLDTEQEKKFIELTKPICKHNYAKLISRINIGNCLLALN